MSINTVSNDLMVRTSVNTSVSMGGSQTEKAKDTHLVGAKRAKSKEKTDIKYPEDRKLSQEEIIDTIEKANNEFIAFDRRFEFSIHEKTKQIMVKVIDVNNDEVIRELPPEKILDMVAAIWEVAGIMIDTKA